jgi:hypothetical protein
MAVIEIHLKALQQLYDSLDPSPFHEKSLDRHAEEYLIDSVGEFGEHEALTLLIQGPDTLRAGLPEMTESIHGHFRLALARQERLMRRRMRMGRLMLLLGLGVLAVTLFTRYWLSGLNTKADLLGESLLIVGWVALWRPAELLLFDRIEARIDRRVLERLAAIAVEFRALPTDAATAVTRS